MSSIHTDSTCMFTTVFQDLYSPISLPLRAEGTLSLPQAGKPPPPTVTHVPLFQTARKVTSLEISTEAAEKKLVTFIKPSDQVSGLQFYVFAPPRLSKPKRYKQMILNHFFDWKAFVYFNLFFFGTRQMMF